MNIFLRDIESMTDRFLAGEFDLMGAPTTEKNLKSFCLS